MAEKYFDVLLAHNGSDKPAVIALAERLKKHGLMVWLDEWELRPDYPWEKAAANIIETTYAMMILVGKDGIFPWKDSDLLRRLVSIAFTALKRPVIPVLLPGCPLPPDLPLSQNINDWVDFRDGVEEKILSRIVKEIKREKLQALKPRIIDWEADISATVTELHLENWKSFDAAKLYFDPFSVLIGANASGKSNALDALQFLSSAASGALLTAALQGDNSVQALRGGIEWAARCPGTAFSLGVKVRADNATDYEYRMECKTEGSHCQLVAEQLWQTNYDLDEKGLRANKTDDIYLYLTDACQPESPVIIVQLLPQKLVQKHYVSTQRVQAAALPKSATMRELPRPASRAQSVLFQLAGQPLNLEIYEAVAAVALSLRGVFILDPIPSHMRDYSPLSDRLAPDARNIAGVIAAMPEAKRKEIEDKLTFYASQLPERDIRRVYAEPVGKFKSDAMLYCEEHWTDAGEPPTVDARGMSDGTLRFLGILTALLTRPAGSLLVVEEVDNGLHPSRARLLLEMLRTVGGERRVDVLVTTHNPALLDAMETDLVPFITVAYRDFATGCSRLTLLEDIDQLPKLLAQGAVGRLSTQGLIEQALHSGDKV